MSNELEKLMPRVNMLKSKARYVQTQLSKMKKPAKWLEWTVDDLVNISSNLHADMESMQQQKRPIRIVGHNNN